MGDKTVGITDASFGDLVKTNQNVVVDCWAAWCGPCRMLSPVIDELAEEYSGKVVFGKLNVDENNKVAVEYNIMSIPTLLFFRGGRLVDRVVGAAPKKQLEDKLKKTFPLE